MKVPAAVELEKFGRLHITLNEDEFAANIVFRSVEFPKGELQQLIAVNAQPLIKRKVLADLGDELDSRREAALVLSRQPLQHPALRFGEHRFGNRERLEHQSEVAEQRRGLLVVDEIGDRRTEVHGLHRFLAKELLDLDIERT